MILFWAAVAAAVVLLFRVLNGADARPDLSVRTTAPPRAAGGGTAQGPASAKPEGADGVTSPPAEESITRTREYGLYAIALAILFVGALALGVPAATLVVLAVVLACPLMMLGMTRGHGGHGAGGRGGADRPAEHPEDPDRDAGPGRT
ncbi:DUF2933 domain-containing protein [Streptomyces durbertensis]|uniref:DUF2933 domain-containing protein n=2 Tax=Streptomyces durbertensis TaxID=2448886 RepID=A0ABR6EFJ0_9ACTN|nr:DUF2933 domain-containing protein [Streptomyces durbertensis]